MEACWICGGPTAPDAALAPLPFQRCDACDFAFRPELAGGAAEVYESGSYEDVRGEVYANEDAIADLDRGAEVRLRVVREQATGGDLLDVGAAGGNFVAVAARAGFRARGVEPTPSFARFAREVVGADVADGTLEQLDLPAASLDVVTMWHVLEHIPDPVRELARVRQALRPEGLLAIEVPNAGGAAAHELGGAWPSLEPDVHVNQFSPRALGRALERAGLAVTALYSLPITPYLRPRQRLDPRHVSSRLKVALTARAPRAIHPTAHELLRAVARPAG